MKFSLNWKIVAFVGLIAAASLGGIAWFVTAQVYSEYSQGLPISGGWSWKKVIIIDLTCFAVFIAFLWKIYRDANTSFHDDELTQPSLRGLRRIKWSEVNEINIFGGVGHHVHTASQKIVVTPNVFANPEEVILTIQERFKVGKRKSENECPTRN